MLNLTGLKVKLRFNPYARSFLATPGRLWRWAQIHPYESIGYGLIMLFLSLAAQPLISIIAGVSIVGGLHKIFSPEK